MITHPLTDEERRVIVERGTEPPFSGEYDGFFEDGIYICRRCHQPLFSAKSKFSSGCGWPSFDEFLPEAVRTKSDPDGHRTEITCAKCDGHLGHVFTGENLTPKDTRHCVNSISIKFVPEDLRADGEQEAVLAGGCFWCVEASMRLVPGVREAISGYTGGSILNPDYQSVSAGMTGHAEAVKVIFDPQKTNFRQILKIFFLIHDPTTLNRQGHDIGDQYRSAIFYLSLRQKSEAEEMVKELEEQKIYSQKIVTKIEPLGKFFPAEEYHQHYFEKHPEAAYCQSVIRPKIEKVKDELGVG